MYSATGTRLSLFQLANSYSSFKTLFRVTPSRREASSKTLQGGHLAHFTLGQDTGYKVLWDVGCGADTCRNSCGREEEGRCLEEEEAFETTWKAGVVLGQGQYWREMMLWRDRVRVLVT